MLASITKTLKKLFGDKSEKDIKELTPLINQAKQEFEKLNSLSNDDLRNITTELKLEIANYIKGSEDKINSLYLKIDENPQIDINEKEEIFKEIDSITKEIDIQLEEVLLKIAPKAFAVVKETAKRLKENANLTFTATEFDKFLATKRTGVTIQENTATWSNTWLAAGNPVTWDMVHYDVQLIGGMGLHQGKVAEMQTGEGKTLVATLPIYLNALAGKGVHIVTVNDYLAKRDSEWMGPLFEFHGLRVDCIDKHQPNSPERKNAYMADITYGTNNEFGFDYLRDNMATSPDGLVQRKHHYAIVDEVDSVLIDDARTPLIISGPTPRGDKQEYDALKPKVEKLYAAQKQLVTNLLTDAKKKLDGIEQNKPTKEELTDGGLAVFRAFRGLPKSKALIKFLSEPGTKQQMLKTESYYMADQNKEMPKADEALYFVIEEKGNSVELTEKGIDLISADISEPNFFIMPDIATEIVNLDKLGLADEDRLIKKDELMRDYSAKAERIHTINQLLKAYTQFEKDVEYVVMDNKVKIVDEQTGRILDGRRYSDGLHQAIESKENVKVEAATQTYATVTLQNYFRMYHKLAGMTGTAETEAGELWNIYKLDVMLVPTNRNVVRKDSEDKVYKTKREKYNAAIEEIVQLSNAGRPVLVGTTSVEISELLSRMLKLRNIKHNVLNAKLHQKEAEIVLGAGQSGAVTIATNMAGRGTDIKLGVGVKEAGGLAIVGTEKHDSRRVDRQLRGRSGRQGDPGSSQFYLSLEDNLMRLFGSDRISKMMDKLGLEEGEVIQHPLITKSIERAQRKVEENNFGIRKRLLEYDDVMSSQREIIYKRRKNALFGDRLSLDVDNIFYETAQSITNYYQENKDFEGFKFELLKNLSIESPLSTEKDFIAAKADDLIMTVYVNAKKHYDHKSEQIAKMALPIIKNISDNQPQFQNIVIPFTDGVKTMQIVTNIKKAIETEGKDLLKSVEKNVVLGIIDNEWKEHLRDMDDLRQSVQNAVYEQKDPLLIYKFESFELFKKMIEKLNSEVVSFLTRSTLPGREDQKVQVEAKQTKAPEPKLSMNRTELPNFGSSSSSGGVQNTDTREKQKPQPIRVEKTVGRNDPCPCGSGKKYKQCHGSVETAKV
jgi:preprotein translocase subunit SecA